MTASQPVLELDSVEYSYRRNAALRGVTLQVKPGEQTVVRLNWKTDGPEGPFRHRADILTNDPSRPAVRLVLNGTLTRGILAEPQSLTLGRIGLRERDQHRRQVDHMRGPTLVERPLQRGQVSDVPLEQLDPFQFLRLEDQRQPRGVRAKVEAGCRDALAEKCAQDPGADAAERPRDEEPLLRLRARDQL